MLQHIIVLIIFLMCLWIVIRDIAHMVRRARNNDPRCLTCSESNCPLRHLHKSSQCTFKDAVKGEKNDEKSVYRKKQEKNSVINLAIQK